MTADIGIMIQIVGKIINKYMKICELFEESADSHRVFAFHGGRDFDSLDFSKLGSGEPGNIRPLGKGLYCGIAVTDDDLYSAIELSKVYANKYGGKTPTIHGFSAILPNKIKNLGYDFEIGKPRSSSKSRETRIGIENEWEAEALPWSPKPGAARAKEAAFLNPSILTRIGKWSADTNTDEIIHDVLNK